MSRFPWLFIIGLIFFLSALASAVYLRQSPRPAPTTSAPSDWQTFSGTDFSFQYPSDWTIRTSQMSTRTMHLFIPSNFMVIEGIAYNQDLGRAQTYSEVITAEDQTGSPKEPITVAGISTHKYIHRVSESGKSLSVVLESPSGQLIRLSMPVPKGEDPAVFDQVLSTFRFEKAANTYTCLASDYIDCMPQIDTPPRTTCQPDYLEWAQANCPGFKGAAY